MRALQWAVVVLVFLVSVPASAARTMAVVPLVEGSAAEEYDGLGTALAGMLMTDLSQVPGIQLVERERLGDILKEIALGNTGYLDPKTAQRLGRGVGAEMVVTGSFSVIDGTLLMDTRMVAVQSGAVLKAANASGPLTDFVSVEKEVVESLVDGLEIQLTMAVRRRLLTQTPTERLEALAHYGRGVEATDDGDLSTARLAFEQAVKQDPGFALAARALADLRSRVEAAQQVEVDLAASSRERAVLAALKELTSELDRKPRFEDTRESLIDLGIRWAILKREGQWCTLYEEQRHFLERTRGRAPGVVDAMPGRRHYDRFQAASALYDARGAELGIAGTEGTYFGSRGGEIIHQAVFLVGKPTQMLIQGSRTPESFESSIAHTMAECLEPPLHEPTWAELVDLAEKLGILEDPIHVVHNEGPSPITVGVAMRLHRAWLRARTGGADDKVIAMTEAELVRYPEGAPGRREVLSTIEGVIAEGEGYERRHAARLQLPEGVLLGLARAVRDRAKSELNVDNALCNAIVAQASDDAKRGLQRVAEARPERRSSAIEGLGAGVISVMEMGCPRGTKPLGYERGLEKVKGALALRHPGSLDDTRCDERVANIEAKLGPDRYRPTDADGQARDLRSLWSYVYQARTSRCLVSPKR